MLFWCTGYWNLIPLFWNWQVHYFITFGFETWISNVFGFENLCAENTVHVEPMKFIGWTNIINYYANQSICRTCKIHGCWCHVPNETYRNLCMYTQRSWEFRNNSLWWSHTLIFHIETKVWSPLTIHTVTYFKTDEII